MTLIGGMAAHARMLYQRGFGDCTSKREVASTFQHTTRDPYFWHADNNRRAGTMGKKKLPTGRVPPRDVNGSVSKDVHAYAAAMVRWPKNIPTGFGKARNAAICFG
ncbi:hypothetical protein TNCV_3913321 [Trichonephila clavipes]|nr:hypothetical protein TNCV_3913321 [Trichonephila clavipes]